MGSGRLIVAVSGGTSGIGRAIAAEGDARGWIMRVGDRLTGLDVRDESTIEAFFKFNVDAAVACAGISIDSLFVTMAPEQVRDVIDTNLNGAFLFARAAIRNGAGAILFIGSLNQLGAPANAVYAASKAALVGLIRAMTKEYPAVRTNLLVPGFVLTPMSERLPEAVQERLRTAAAIGRGVELSEVARAAADLLLCPMHGRVVRVTGGLLDTPL
ncbi:MAG TPA: SDR family oxidoreductase [Candidatus Binatia bacterium]|jgi:3-oxoacyl-[acyl-carrier protein] reductase|nr:SDR family oxidoreductase [Candidatus Binatia bacterium]